MQRLLLALGAIVPLACGSASFPPDTLVGRWGGSSANLLATDSGGSLHQVCSVVSIRAPLRAGPDGHFSAPGQRSRVGGPPPSVPEPVQHVVVTGEKLLRDDKFLRLTLLEAKGTQLGEPLVLRRDAVVEIPGCP